ncbi:MAG: hypothetical protein KDA78_17520, partial [Planctomycetaceae bacterium]|nr:hypothetical protein [Planctomycetaceae bacterium]
VRQLLVQGRLIEQQVRFMSTAIETSKNRDLAVTEFNKFHELWGPFAAQLWPLNNRYLERSLQRIEQTDRQLHEVLWLDKTLDTRQLQRLTSVLTADLDKLFKTTTLYSLMSMQNRDVLLRAATDLNIANKKLADSLAANKQLAQLQAEFRALDQSWHQVETAYKGCEEPEILRLLRSSSQTMLSIQNALQLEDAFDRDTAVQILASLENYGEHMQESFSTLVLPNQQYSRRFSIQGLHTAQQFTAFTRNIHYDLAEGVEPEELRARCDTLVRGWKYLNEEFIQKLNGSEREQLSRLSAQITPLMVQLQTMFDV